MGSNVTRWLLYLTDTVNYGSGTQYPPAISHMQRETTSVRDHPLEWLWLMMECEHAEPGKNIGTPNITHYLATTLGSKNTNRKKKC